MQTQASFKYWRKRVFITAWITYAAFYLTRVNMSIAMPGIMAEFGYTKTMMGGILSALFIMYAVGQFVNGQLGDKYGARKLVTIGLLASAVLSAVFGFTSMLLAMAILWGANGFFQAMGFSPSVKTIANWFPIKKRSKMSGLFGTSYQIGNAVSWALAGLVVGLLGWRWAFWIPAGITAVLAVHFYWRIRNAPEEVGLPTVEEEENGIERKEAKKDEHLGFKHTINLCLTRPRIWVVAFGLFFLNIIRYGFMAWAPTYFFEVQQASISMAAFKAIALPAAGCLGAIASGWISGKVFQDRKAPIAATFLFLLAFFAWLYPLVPAGNWITSLAVLLFIGFFTYGPHVMMVAGLPMDLGTRKAAASATGFIDGVGYVGAAFTGIGTGFLIDMFGWNAAFYFWVISAIVAGILMLLIWGCKPIMGKYH